MKIIDCLMYFDEDLLLDIRLNTLSKYVDKFIICEAKFNHKGLKKKLNFDINKFKKYQNKIDYIVLENQPKDLKIINETDTNVIKSSKVLDNSLMRENYQRNYCQEKLKEFSNEDLVLINDLDEIPNLENFVYKNKITIFKQKLFYYKFNLLYPDYNWMGSKICKIKHLKTPQFLRNIKPKKYPFWRLDILVSEKKFNNLSFIDNGGWHFTNVKSAELIDHKMKNFLHHLEYEESGLNVEKLKELIKEKKIMYDHNADKKNTSKWNNTKSLEKVSLEILPSYIRDNKSKFAEWID
jgi:beta-1,4-mannosyl-glycoprotein beta-1,4-N-acetylglucosaminyltransferase